jgi:tetratricopeptide (TPR) repeat protein
MLFDLRGKGRRRAVKFIYIGLALLMGGGAVLFGVGSFGGTGVLSSLNSNEGSNAASFSSQIKKYRKATETQPKNEAAWEKLTEALLHEAGGEAYVTSRGVTSKGKELFTQADQAWTSYLALNPPKPSAKLAQLMLQIYGEEGLKQPEKAVQVLQIVVAARPTSASLYAALAEYAYKAHNVRVGDLASAKAVSLAPAAQRVRVKNELAEVKKNPSGEKVYTTTTNGKTYTGKLGPNGTLQATEVPTTSTGAGTTTPTSTTKKK